MFPGPWAHSFLVILQLVTATCGSSLEAMASWRSGDPLQTVKIVLPVAASQALKGDIKSGAANTP